MSQTSEQSYCMQCGETIAQAAEICPECGIRQDVSNITSDKKHCTSCGDLIKLKAEICPECGVSQSTEGSGVNGTDQSALSDEVSSAGEAFSLMLSYYREMKWRGILHVSVSVLTGGFWLGWFLFFWLGTYMGWKDMEKLRRIHQGGTA